MKGKEKKTKNKNKQTISSILLIYIMYIIYFKLTVKLKLLHRVLKFIHFVQ